MCDIINTECILKMDLSEKLKRLRGYFDLSQSELAEKINVTKSHISEAERGNKSFSIDVLNNIIKTFKLDARYFFGQLETPEEADLTKRGNIGLSGLEALKKEIEELKYKVNPESKIDKVAERVIINQDLHDLVELVQFWDSDSIRRIIDMANAYMIGRKDSDAKKRNAS